MINKCTYLKNAVKDICFYKIKIYLNHRDNNQIASFIRKINNFYHYLS